MPLPNQPLALQILLPSWLATVAEKAPDADLRLGAAVLVEGSRILQVGPAEALLNAYPQADRVDLTGKLLIPGLINMHTHAAMSLLRGLGDELPLDAWLNERIWPLEKALLSEEFVYDGTVLAAHEMLLGGVTCFNDMYFFPASVARAAADMGMRAMVGMPILEFATGYAHDLQDYVRKGLSARDEFRGQAGLGFALAPHAPYSVSNEGFQQVQQLSQELGCLVHCHVHETAQEVQDSLQQWGRRPLQRLYELGVLGPEFLAVHGVHVNASDRLLLRDHGATLVHCPHSNLKLGAGIAPVAQVLEDGVRVCIGTDGSASNNSLDLMEEARCASLLAKGFSGNAGAWPAAAVLRAMTLDAARALGWDQELGSIEAGKQADMVALDFSGASLQPVYDAMSHFIYSSKSAQVSEVWIAGENVVRMRQLVSASSRRSIGEVTSRLALWHNSIGELMKAGRK
jgi:5-methylthioadenosine/S-adenosylhomocysteine deaminase